MASIASNFMSSIFNKKQKGSTILPLFVSTDNVKCYDFDFEQKNCLSTKKSNTNFKIYPINESNNSSKVSINIDSAIYEDNSTYKIRDLNKHVDSPYIVQNHVVIDTDTTIHNNTNNTSLFCCNMV